MRVLPNFVRLTCCCSRQPPAHACCRSCLLVCAYVWVLLRRMRLNSEFNLRWRRYRILSGCHGNEMPLTLTMNSGVGRTNGLSEERCNLHSGRSSERRLNALSFQAMVCLGFVCVCGGVSYRSFFFFLFLIFNFLRGWCLFIKCIYIHRCV